MAQMLTVSRAAHLIGVTRASLQKMISAGELSSFDGMVSSEDLTRLFPDIRLEESGAFERITKIREEAFGRRVRERILPNQEILAERLAAQSEELEDVRRHLAHYHDLIEALRERMALAANDSPQDALADLASFLDQGLASVLGSEEPADAVAVMDEVLRVVSAHVTVKPSGREFFVEGNESVLKAALRAGLAPSYGCGNGNCGLCKARVVSGKLHQVQQSDYLLSANERAQGYALLCSHTAVSDLVVEMLEAHSAADIPQQEIVARVKSATPLDGEVMMLHLQTPRSNRLRFLAGQSLTLSVTGSTATFRGDYAIASCPCDDRNLLFHIRRDDGDEFARRLFAGALKAQDAVSIFGPWGDFILDQDSRRPLLFIACDTGFAPMPSLIDNALAADEIGTMTMVWAATRPGGHYLANQCRAWADALDDFRYVPLTAADAAAAATAALQAVRQQPEDPAACDVYVAGGPSFTPAVVDGLRAAGVPEAQIHSVIY
ncbi:CDP-4-dehydro-6-deoxyglucose reductase [Sulfurisoma sediminicola]|uniref:CDP-4-dehydro-6-deoxyglucose reductase n=2 Tax=Sulfurisoma sediminicola TaxID=1381557 RepID=A0A497XJS2_9PROT|nr:CDP-4-dehydro-6-deoxyglucose reductase [Sulfurisoma sediminicola]